MSVWPAFAYTFATAIEKHDECAAAMNSSGLVSPFASSARAVQFTPKLPRPDESSDTVPLPPASSAPSQCVDAVRVVAMSNPFGAALRQWAGDTTDREQRGQLLRPGRRSRHVPPARASFLSGRRHRPAAAPPLSRP